MPTNPTTPASRPALPLGAVATTVISPSGPASECGLVRDGNGDTIAECPTLAGAVGIVAAVNDAVALRGLLAECGEAFKVLASVGDQHAANLAWAPTTNASRVQHWLRLVVEQSAALAAKVAAAVGPAKADNCAWCITAGDETYCHHCTDAPECIVCGRGTNRND